MLKVICNDDSDDDEGNNDIDKSLADFVRPVDIHGLWDDLSLHIYTAGHFCRPVLVRPLEQPLPYPQYTSQGQSHHSGHLVSFFYLSRLGAAFMERCNSLPMVAIALFLKESFCQGEKTDEDMMR